MKTGRAFAARGRPRREVAHAGAVADVVRFAVPLIALIAFAVAVVLVRSALRSWWEQSAGLAYELPAAYGGTASKAAWAALSSAVALTAAITAGVTAGSAGDDPPVHIAAASSVPPAPAPPASVEAEASHKPRARRSAPAHRHAAPHRSTGPSGRKPARPTPPDGPARTIGHPEGGTLQVLADGTRVWLPPQYAYPQAADLVFPVVVVYARAADRDPDMFRGFLQQTQRRLADPFVVVLPARCGAAPTPSLLARHYRLASGRSGHAVLGVADQADCAVREAFAHPARYGAAVGVSGMYGDAHDLIAASGPYRPQVLLATVSGEEPERACAFRFRAALRGAPAEVRVMDRIWPRRRLFALVAGYFTEKLDGPALTARLTNHPIEGEG